MRKIKSYSLSLKGTLSFCFHSLLLLCYHTKTHRQWGIMFVFSIFYCHFFPPPHTSLLFLVLSSSHFSRETFCHLSEPLLLFFLPFLCHLYVRLFCSLPLWCSVQAMFHFLFRSLTSPFSSHSFSILSAPLYPWEKPSTKKHPKVSLLYHYQRCFSIT